MAVSGSGAPGSTSRTNDPFEGTSYKLVRPLGAGGMSEVFLIAHRELEKQFVAKVLRTELAGDQQTLDRVRIEAQALGRLSHQNIVSVTDVRTLRDGRPFIVMEHLRGRPLSVELAERKPLPVREALVYARELLSALAAVHGMGMVHRDVKPSNLFLCDLPGGRKALKILDFGVARVLPGAPASAPLPLAVPTATGAVVGTPRYISPEGAAGEHVDHRADLYGAALVLYAMLTGRGPFDHARASELLSVRTEEDPEPPSRFATDPVPPELDALILKALERRPDARFQTAGEFREAIEQVEELLTRPSGWLQTTAIDGSGAEKTPPLVAYDTTQSAERATDGDETRTSEENVLTRTAEPREIPLEDERPALSRTWRRTATIGAFLIIASIAFAVAVGVVRFARAYLENG
jgi:serine/threonine protein kinase